MQLCIRAVLSPNKQGTKLVLPEDSGRVCGCHPELVQSQGTSVPFPLQGGVWCIAPDVFQQHSEWQRELRCKIGGPQGQGPFREPLESHRRSPPLQKHVLCPTCLHMDSAPAASKEPPCPGELEEAGRLESQAGDGEGAGASQLFSARFPTLWHAVLPLQSPRQ